LLLKKKIEGFRMFGGLLFEEREIH